VGVLMMIALAGITAPPSAAGFQRRHMAALLSRCGTLLARADEVIERGGQLFEPGLIDSPRQGRLRVHQRRFKRKPRASASPRHRTYRCVASLGDQIG
jgi:hypothetical protein